MEHGDRTPRIDEIDFRDLFDLSAHGSDTYIGRVARYPWGDRLFGGQVVAQALRAAIHTVDPDRAPHSFHSYFIRPGSPFEPVRFEVERLRDGRSFTTRQVVARQSAGAILNASVSFQIDEPDEVDVQLATLDPALPAPEDPSLRNDSWGALLDRRAINLPGERYGYWIRLLAELGDDPILNVCGLTFMSDAAPFRAGRSAHPEFSNDQKDRERFVGASLDHSLWFHRPTLANEWHWFDTRSHGLAHGRGLATGDVITAEGVHAATLAQQVLLRRNRNVE